MTGTRTREERAEEAFAEDAEAWDGCADGDAGEPLDAEAGVAAFREAVEGGEPWYAALLDVVARWVTPEEVVDGVVHRYLVGGEAFDWLLLAQRLIGAAEDLVPREQAERTLFYNESPRGETEREFAEAIGEQKYRAHLNFQYGVVVEQVLLLAAELDLQKAKPIDGARGVPPDIEAYERVYGHPLEELKMRYRAETGRAMGDRVHQAELHEFTYWCSKFRVTSGEPARVASDTRKAMALLSRLHAARARQREREQRREVVIEA